MIPPCVPGDFVPIYRYPKGERVTHQDINELEAQVLHHYHIRGGVCAACGEPFPCMTIEVIRTLVTMQHQFAEYL